MMGLRSSFRKRAGCRADMTYAGAMAVAVFVAAFSIPLLQLLRIVPFFGMAVAGLAFRSPLLTRFKSTGDAALAFPGHLRAILSRRDQGVGCVGAS